MMNMNKIPTYQNSKRKWNLFEFKKIIIFGFFTSILILGLNIYKDFGISYDEIVERKRGLVTLKYIGQKFKVIENLIIKENSKFENLPNLENYQDGDHGPVFDILATTVEIVLGIDDDKEIYELRHLITFLIFWCGLIAIYLIASKRYENWKIGLLAVIFMILSPRIFAESFYNSKDMVFLSLFIIAIYFGVNFLLQPKLLNALYLALFSAIATDVRLLGVLIPAGIIICLALPVDYKENKLTINLKYVAIYISLYIFFVIVFWPWLWTDPISQIKSAFSNLSKFPVQPPTLYLGKSILYNAVPWHYIPMWILITTPLLYLFLGVYGVYNAIWNITKNIKSKKMTKNGMQDLIFLGYFLGPIFIVICLKSTLYDGWRHLYFIYPAFIMLVLGGLIKIYQIVKNRKKILFIAVIIINLIIISRWMINAHPYQNLYFNNLVGSNHVNKFDVDYWGLTGRQAVEEILLSDTRERIRIFGNGVLNIEADIKMISVQKREILNITNDINEADYVLTNYRGELHRITDYKDIFSIFKNIVVDKEIVFSIYKRNEN